MVSLPYYIIIGQPAKNFRSFNKTLFYYFFHFNEFKDRESERELDYKMYLASCSKRNRGGRNVIWPKGTRLWTAGGPQL